MLSYDFFSKRSSANLVVTLNLVVLLQAGLVNPERRVVDPLRLPLSRNFKVIPDAVPTSLAAAAALGVVAPARHDLQAGEWILVGQVEGCERRKRRTCSDKNDAVKGMGLDPLTRVT